MNRFLWSEKVVEEVFQVPEQRFHCVEQVEQVFGACGEDSAKN